MRQPSSSPHAPADLTAGAQGMPATVATPLPVLAWQAAPLSVGVTGFELEAVIGDSDLRRHRQTGTSAPYVRWPWEALPSREVIRWRVRTLHGVETSPWAEWSSFRTALFRGDDWVAQWISPPGQAGTEEADRPAYVLRRSCDLTAPVQAATLYASALGVYEIFINGVRVGEQELTPGSSNYDETLYAQSYDVGESLTLGANLLEIVLSDGWYRGRNGGPQLRDVWGATTAALAQLEIVSDAGIVVVATDAHWECTPSSIVRADLMTGQTTDLRIMRSEEFAVPVIVGAVAAPVPQWSPSPPVRRIEELRPVSVTAHGDGVSIVDLGQNISGWLRLGDLGQPGDETTIEFGEHLGTDGDLDTTHLDLLFPDGGRLEYHQIDRVIAGDDGSAVFEPRHTVHGFQFARISHPGRELRGDSVTGVVVHTDLRRTGGFSCSDPDIERLHDTAVWSFRDNAVDIPTDCPTRERSGWTGDFQVFASTAAFVYDIAGFGRKWLQGVRDDQFESGSLAMFSPDSERMKVKDHPMRVGGGAAGWGDAAVSVPWTLYEYYGDIGVLEESWASMTAWMEYALKAARESRHPSRIARSSTPAAHEQYIWDGTFHFGEWMEPKKRRDDGTYIDPLLDDNDAFLHADNGELATAYLYRSTRQLADAACELGRAFDAAMYGELATEIRAAWIMEFLDERGRTSRDTQASYVRALGFGLVPEDLRENAAARLAELVESADVRLQTGFLSTGLLLPVLADNGYGSLAFQLLQRRGVPSWLGMLERGATTLWENWEGIDDTGRADGSLNHYSKGAVAQFFYTHIAGLRQAPGSVAWARVVVAPQLGGGLTSATASFVSPRGLLRSAWSLEEHRFTLEVQIPAGTTAEIRLPDGDIIDVGAGSHRLACSVTTHSDLQRTENA